MVKTKLQNRANEARVDTEIVNEIKKRFAIRKVWLKKSEERWLEKLEEEAYAHQGIYYITTGGEYPLFLPNPSLSSIRDRITQIWNLSNGASP